MRDKLRQNHLTLDGHDLFESVQSHLTLFRGGEVTEERGQDFVKDSRTCAEK